MLRNDLERAIGKVPDSFARRMADTLESLPQRKAQRRWGWQRVLVIALVGVLLCGTALALANLGLNWYFTKRLESYVEHEPQRYNAIMDNLVVPQSQQDGETAVVQLAVTEASLAMDERVLALMVTGVPADGGVDVLYPRGNLDVDGMYMAGGPKDAGMDEERGMHWLWTRTGAGPVKQMIPEGRRLLLIDVEAVRCGGVDLVDGGSAMDWGVDERGQVYFVFEIELNFLDDAHIAALEARAAEESDEADEAYFAGRLQDAKALRERFERGGPVELTVPYSVYIYSDDDAAMNASARQGEMRFVLDVAASDQC